MVRITIDQPFRPFIQTIRNPKPQFLSRTTEMIITFRIEPRERDFLMEIEFLQKIINRLSFSTEKNVVDRRAKRLRSHRKTVGTSARIFVRLQQTNGMSRFRQ